MTHNSNGSSNRLMYDRCATEQRINDSIFSQSYYIFPPYGENIQRCGGIKNTGMACRVDTESELKAIKPPASKCPQFKYNPNCNSNICQSTYNMTNVLPFDICPIVANNLPKFNNVGYTLKIDKNYVACEIPENVQPSNSYIDNNMQYAPLQ